MPRPGVEPGLRPSGRWERRLFRPRAGAAGADERATAAWCARAQCWPSTTTPSPGVVLAALVCLSGLPGEFRPLRVCQTHDHRCLPIRCLYAVPGVPPGGRSCCGAVLLAPRAPTRTAPRSKREPDGWERQPAAASALRSQRRTGVLHRRRRPVHHGDARSCRWYIGSPVGRRGTRKHCKGDHVPTLRPLLAVTGPPRQYGPKPCSTWPLAELQRPRPLPFARLLAPQGHRNSKTSTPVEE